MEVIKEEIINLKMAKKEDKKKKIVLEKSYNVPLRKEYMKAPRWKRTPRAIKAIKSFIARHAKSDNIKIGKYLNDFMWKHGMKNPPHHVKVDVTKDEDGLVKAELVGAPKEEPKLEKPSKKEGEPKKPPEDLTTAAAQLEKKLSGKKEEKTEKAKEVEKQEIKELKKEHPKERAPKQPAAPKQVEQHPTAPMGR